MHVYLDEAVRRYRESGRLTSVPRLKAALEEGAVDRVRPGDTVDFGHVDVDAPGRLPRPDESCDPRELSDHAYGLVRVLGDDGWALRPPPRSGSFSQRR